MILHRAKGRCGIGLVEGVGESSDAYHISAPHPEGLGGKAGHGASHPRRRYAGRHRPCQCARHRARPTTINAESRAIRELSSGSEVPVISTKGYTGHTLGGAGATEIALALIMMAGRLGCAVGRRRAGQDADYGINVITERTPARSCGGCSATLSRSEVTTSPIALRSRE